MRFISIDQILAKIQQQPGWEQYQQYCQILECWQKTVPKNTEKHTRPLYIKRQVLWVAVSSSARAQELSFQRYHLLKKLNTQLPFSLKDIRFSTSEWKPVVEPKLNPDRISIVNKNQKSAINLNHRKSIKNNADFSSKNNDSPDAKSNDPQASVRRWLELVQTRSDSDRFCPQCGSLTPDIELKRWNCCHHCVAQKWSTEYRPPTKSNDD